MRIRLFTKRGNVCAKGHRFVTRIPLISKLWWLNHEKCFDGIYRKGW